MNAEQTSRNQRIYQAAHRKSPNSHRTQVEDCQVILAWINEDLTESQAANALGYDIVSLRELRHWHEQEGGRLARKLLEPSATTARKKAKLMQQLVELTGKRPPGNIPRQFP